MCGAQSLNDAHKDAIRRKIASEKGEDTMVSLRERASDLADLVDEERMTLHEALVVLAERENAAKANRYAFALVVNRFLSKAATLSAQLELTPKMYGGHSEEIEKNLDLSFEETEAAVRAIDVQAIADMIQKVGAKK
jgi:hypothetical protein